MGTGVNESYNRFSSTQTIATNILIVPFFAQHPTVGTRQFSRTHGHEIIAVNTGSKKFTLDGDLTDIFKDGETFEVRASVGNDGTYTVNGDATLASEDTEIIVDETITDSNVCGVIDPGGLVICEVELQADTDETTGEQDLQPWARFKITPDIDDSLTNDGTGAVTFVVEFTPIQGDGGAGTAVSHTFTHPEDCDSWQAAGGRARQ